MFIQNKIFVFVTNLTYILYYIMCSQLIITIFSQQHFHQSFGISYRLHAFLYTIDLLSVIVEHIAIMAQILQILLKFK